jgi:hypothetical protein
MQKESERLKQLREQIMNEMIDMRLHRRDKTPRYQTLKWWLGEISASIKKIDSKAEIS